MHSAFCKLSIATLPSSHPPGHVLVCPAFPFAPTIVVSPLPFHTRVREGSSRLAPEPRASSAGHTVGVEGRVRTFHHSFAWLYGRGTTNLSLSPLLLCPLFPLLRLYLGSSISPRVHVLPLAFFSKKEAKWPRIASALISLCPSSPCLLSLSLSLSRLFSLFAISLSPSRVPHSRIPAVSCVLQSKNKPESDNN
ncbi:unnamed protein product [Mortierella alpina]